MNDIVINNINPPQQPPMGPPQQMGPPPPPQQMQQMELPIGPQPVAQDVRNILNFGRPQLLIPPVETAPPGWVPDPMKGYLADKRDWKMSSIHPSDDTILKKIREMYKDDPEGYESDYGLMKERGETPQEWLDQMHDQV